ncbi:hypothetical protein QCE73_37080 [Caballeronia sp. LZ029]|uniref:hypothetical protein n=1 Tax=Caballeronia sp. LZ029 TaxID=3038564 RepID=UPI002862B77A|nr:hypothetical protein [Caballeronia sp. LZ029]MDR5748798.1 hypothetical protein [Caballeronia sp. LZ029]
MIAFSVGFSRPVCLHASRPSIEGALRSVLLSAVIGLGGLLIGHSSNAQALFVGDAVDSSVKQFDVATGTYAGAFVPAGANGLNGPMGMIFTNGQFLLVNQNVNSNSTGEILRFDGATGAHLTNLVSANTPNAPFAPRGIVRGGPDNSYYVADMVGESSCANGSVKRYDDAGTFLGNLDLGTFTDVFHPRGVVFGPDGDLYVSSAGCLDPNDAHFDPLKGNILRFDRTTGRFVKLIASNGTVTDLHRPEGLVFDNAGKLWVTSFQADPKDTDKVLKLDATTGGLLDKLPLSKQNATPRSYAQAIIFGPGGKLYIPITGTDKKTTGEVRRCDTTTKLCDVVIPTIKAGGAIGSGWYLIFKNSDPATLNYRNN